MEKSIIEKIKALFKEEKEEMTFIDVKTNDGRILRVTEMVIGGMVKELTEDGEIELVGELEFITENGFIVMVKDGVIEDIKEPVMEEMEEEVKVEMANVMRTDGVAIYYEGTELVVGETKLFLDEAMTQPAPEGEHLLEGGIKVTIENGVLTEMEEVKEEEEVVEEFGNVVLSAIESLRTEIQSLKAENQKLSERFNKFASEPSDEPTNTKVDFSTLDKKQIRDERLKFFGSR
jgi:FtsZ-binding cell division protein ZapB